MTRTIRIGISIAAFLPALWILTGTQTSSAGGKDAGPPAPPPEMKIMAKRVGTWKTVSRIKPAEWTPEGGKTEGEEKIELVLGGRFIQGRARTQPGDVEAIWHGTFDPGRKVYRVWYFDSLGNIVDSTGTWDPKSNTLTWRETPQPGITSNFHWRFIDDDTFEWDVLARDAAGKVYLDMAGKLTRKK